jgi:peptide deformylase
MRLSILSLGHKILKEKCENISPDYPNLGHLISDMWETMQNGNGCGLAASQIGRPIRLFIVNSKSTYENLEENERQEFYDAKDKGIIETFINAQIIERSDRCWDDNEGCLSIPDLSQSVKRPWSITIAYFNLDFKKQTRKYSGTTARIIQHEYDHTEGILYLDHLNPLTKMLIESRLKRIMKGQVITKYPMKFLKKARHQ